jgi:hypothetical protein
MKIVRLIIVAVATVVVQHSSADAYILPISVKEKAQSMYQRLQNWWSPTTMTPKIETCHWDNNHQDQVQHEDVTTIQGLSTIVPSTTWRAATQSSTPLVLYENQKHLESEGVVMKE